MEQAEERQTRGSSSCLSSTVSLDQPLLPGKIVQSLTKRGTTARRGSRQFASSYLTSAESGKGSVCTAWYIDLVKFSFFHF